MIVQCSGNRGEPNFKMCWRLFKWSVLLNWHTFESYRKNVKEE